jgi:copper chaperone CopZ
MNTTLTFQVAEMSTGHCEAAITEEITQLEGVTSVEIDLDTHLVRVSGWRIDGHAVIAAIDAVGYGAVRI